MQSDNEAIATDTKRSPNRNTDTYTRGHMIRTIDRYSNEKADIRCWYCGEITCLM